MSDTLTIGVDHGYAAMKTAHFSFPTGLVEYEHEPYTQQDVLDFGGRFYVVGSGRQPLQKDKTVTEDYYLLTLAAIAKELACHKADAAASIHLAAGLPLTSFGRGKKKFRSYLLRDGKPVAFRYEGTSYAVTISEVSLFPQGYAAVLTQPDLLGEPSVILADIGGWTVDLMRLDNRVPNAATCRSLELGMIRCLDETAEQVRRKLGLSMTAAQIESVLCGEQAITYRWADEDIGHNVGELTLKGGEVIDLNVPEDGSREAYEMAAEIMNVDLSDYDLCLTADGSSYEYRSPDEAPAVDKGGSKPAPASNQAKAPRKKQRGKER